MQNISEIQNLLKQNINISRQNNPLFFKTGPEEYAEHDKFLGISVPIVRKISKQFVHLSLEEIQYLLSSPYNEKRLLALFIVVLQYKKTDILHKHELYQFYMSNIQYVNNWNLVDQSADELIGAYLFEFDQNKDVLIKFAHSQSLWERRIAIIATFYFIKRSDFIWTFEIAKIMLNDSHDLIHKAVGWMLREVGNKDIVQLKLFLDEHALCMPRTMLRYAIEKFSQEERLNYLQKKYENIEQ